MITTIQISGANEGLWCSDVELGQGTLKMVTGFPQISILSNTYLVPPGAWHTRGGQGLHWQLLGSAVKVGKGLCDWEWWQNSQIWCEPASFWGRGAGPLCRSPVTSQVALKGLSDISKDLNSEHILMKYCQECSTEKTERPYQESAVSKGTKRRLFCDCFYSHLPQIRFTPTSSPVWRRTCQVCLERRRSRRNWSRVWMHCKFGSAQQMQVSILIYVLMAA